MKKIFAISIVILAAAAVCSADVTLVQKVNTGAMMGQPAQNFDMTMYIKGSKARIETSNGQQYQIIDLTQKKMFVIDPAKKQANVLSSDVVHKAGQMAGEMMKNAKSSAQKTGKSETINGYKCEEYLVTVSGPMSITSHQWVTQDVELTEFEAFEEYTQSFSKILGGSLPDIKGLPIRSETKMNMMGQNIDAKVEVVRISKDAVADSLFVVPAGYKVQEATRMPNQ